MVDLVFSRQPVHRLQDRSNSERRRADGGLGKGIRRRNWLRLLFRVSPLYAGMQRTHAVLSGPFDPRREVLDDLAGSGRSSVWPAFAGGLARAVRDHSSAWRVGGLGL